MNLEIKTGHSGWKIIFLSALLYLLMTLLSLDSQKGQESVGEKVETRPFGSSLWHSDGLIPEVTPNGATMVTSS